MSKFALLLLLFLWAFSFLVFTPTLNVLPEWITENQRLYQFTIIGVNFAFILAFWKWGLSKL